MKVLKGRQHPEPDAHFRYINGQAATYPACGDPVISVDAKKKELVGQYKKAGGTWRPKGQPEKVNVHDFMDKELGKVTPYGVYGMAANSGWVNVGTAIDTAHSRSARSAPGGTRPGARPAPAPPGC